MTDSRFTPIHLLRARPRLFSALTISALILILLPESLVPRQTTRLLLAWNGGVWVYLGLALRMMITSLRHHIESRARTQYEGRYVVLGCVALTTASCLAAIFAELATVKQLHGALKYGHIALTGMTVISAWLFVHTMFALHYAHDYYLRGKNAEHPAGGLQFPETPHPDYLDFLYFSCIIGTSGQTADIAISSARMRRIALVHCILSYAFNATVLALTINIAAGLI